MKIKSIIFISGIILISSCSNEYYEQNNPLISQPEESGLMIGSIENTDYTKKRLDLLVEQIKKKEKTIDYKYEDGDTALIKAASIGDLNTLNFLLKEGADINIQGKNNDTALNRAVLKNQYDATELLLSKGADSNILGNIHPVFSKEGTTPFLQSLFQENEKIAYLLLKHGVSINNEQDTVFWAPLKMYDFLFKNGANSNGWDKRSNSPVLMALITLDSNNNVDPRIIQLIEKGANINIGDATGYTPLMKAVEMRNIELIEYLLKKGSNKKAIDLSGNTALDYTRKKSNHWNESYYPNILTKNDSEKDKILVNKIRNLLKNRN